MRNVHLKLELLGPWQGVKLVLLASSVDGPEARLEWERVDQIAITTGVVMPYGAVCRLRLLDVDARGDTLQQFRKTFIACDLLPTAERNERISVVDLQVE